MLKNQYKIIFGFSVFVMVGYLYFFRYNLLIRDDYYYLLLRLQGNSAVETAIIEYLRWNGRFVANFFYGLFMYSTSHLAYKIITAAWFIIFYFSVFFINLSTGVGKRKTVYISTIFFAVLLLSINTSRDSFYWMGGICNYIIAIIFLITGCTPLVRPFHNRTLGCLFSAFFCALSSMCNEMFTPMAVFLMLTVGGISFYRKDKYRFYLCLLIAGVLAAGFLAVYLSPGNSIRGEDGREKLAFLTLIWRATMTTLERSGDWLFITPLIPSALIVSVFVKDKLMIVFPDKNYSFHCFFFLGLGLCLCFIPHFIHGYTLGYPGLPGRAKFNAQFFFQSAAFLSVIYFSKYFKIDIKLDINSKWRNFVLAVFFIILIPNRDFIPSLFYLDKMQGYYESILERINILSVPSSELVILKPYPYQPPVMRGKYFDTDFEKQQVNVLGNDNIFILDGKDGYANYHFDTYAISLKSIKQKLGIN